MKTAINCYGDLIMEDETKERKVYRNEEARLIQKTMNSYAQKKRAGIYISETILIN